MRLVLVGRRRAETVKSSDPGRARACAISRGSPANAPTSPDLLRGLDCFVLPSLAEGVSNTILEAMASALPVVATRRRGERRAGRGRRDRRLVPAADSEALARAMVAYFDDPATARRMAAAGRRRVERSFSLDRMVERYHRLYSELLRNRHRAASETLRPHPAGEPWLTRGSRAMCGIVGIFDTRGRREISRELVSRMNETQHHRGPDEGGVHVEPGVGLRPPAAVDHRSVDRPAAAVQRGRQRRRHLQRRDLQLPVADSGAGGARPHVPHQERHRGHRSRVGGVGRSVRRALPRHVRVRAVGPQPRDAVSRARPPRREAAPLRAARRRHVPVRLGAEVAARARRVAREIDPLRGRGVFRAGLRARAAHDLRGRAEAAAGAHADAAPWRAGSGARRVLGPVASRSTGASDARRCDGRAVGAAATSRSACA